MNFLHVLAVTQLLACEFHVLTVTFHVLADDSSSMFKLHGGSTSWTYVAEWLCVIGIVDKAARVSFAGENRIFVYV